ncbi:hypothetical protein [uncultured Roseovarius sp.]|uniref:hypothetical protein n=1 Tax=uncultured Roseovarius sp. TaxID=293344 RepID=UPI00261E2523|nr:hypothetical protein [uncultured Roseovarius sp.]
MNLFAATPGVLKRFAILAAVAVFPFGAMADVRSDAAQALEMWQPTSIKYSNGTLTVVLPQQRITEDIYTAALSNGLCLGTLYGKDFSAVKEFVVLNRHGAQGYVYERGGTDCEAILDEDQRRFKDLRIHILGATHWY